MRKFLTYTLTVFVTLATFAQSPADSVRVFFRISQSQFDPSLGNNHAAMDDFLQKVDQRRTDIESIVVRAYASPEGNTTANKELSIKRCQAITNYIIEHTGINRDIIQSVPEGEAWGELRQLVAETPDVPSRDSILHILDNTPEWAFDASGKIIDSRKKQLMSLKYGVPYRWMLANLFPQLRSAVAVTLYIKPSHTATNVQETVSTNSTKNAPDAADIQITDTIYADTLPSRELLIAPPKIPYHFAVKTNLLYDGALLPNLEVEWLINNRWSVALEGDVAWWKHDPSHRYYQLAVVSPEVRYWFRTSKLWHGMYVGLFAGGGLYDLENRKNGYQGEGAMTGLSFGYMWPIGKHLSFEAGVGAGYMYTRYKEYEPADGHYLYQRTKSLNYFGPLRVKFSIGWRFDVLLKTKKNNPVL